MRLGVRRALVGRPETRRRKLGNQNAWSHDDTRPRVSGVEFAGSPLGDDSLGASWPRRGSGDAGFVGGFEGLLFGLLLFVVGTLLVAHAWAVIDTKAATEEAARQAARTYIGASSAATALSSAERAASDALIGYGRDPSRSEVSLVTGSFGRCQRITIAVSYPAPVLILPFVGRIGTGEGVKSLASELVDPYRSGLSGSATCA